MTNTVSENKLLEPGEVRALSKISLWRGILAVFGDWVIIVAAIIVTLYLNHPVVYFITWLVIGTRMYALYSLLHDGIHYLLFPDRKVNDWLCRLFLAWPLFISLNAIRKHHLAHHQHLKTPDDPEAAHLQYNEFQFPKRPAQLAFIFFKDITGINFIIYRYLKAARFLSGGGHKQNVNQPLLPYFRFDAGMIIYYLVIIPILIYTGHAIHFILFWIIPYITIYQFFNRLRLSTEHFHIPGDKPYQTRTVKLNIIEQFIFSPHYLGFHTEHHLYPGVPHYRLPALHKKLVNEIQYRENMLVDKSYFSVMMNYLK